MLSELKLTVQLDGNGNYGKVDLDATLLDDDGEKHSVILVRESVVMSPINKIFTVQGWALSTLIDAVNRAEHDLIDQIASAQDFRIHEAPPCNKL
jgi:hypothetical protein